MPKKKYVDDESDHEASDDGDTSVESTGNLAPLLKMDIKKQLIMCSKTMSGKSHLFCSLLYHLAKKGAFNQCPTQIVVFWQPKNPRLIQAHAGTFEVTKSQIIQVDDGHY